MSGTNMIHIYHFTWFTVLSFYPVSREIFFWGGGGGDETSCGVLFTSSTFCLKIWGRS